MRKLQPAPTHPVPAAAARAEKKRFLGETLAPQAEESSPWLVQAVLGGAPPLEITRDGVIPWRFNGVLPLRHGFSRTGAPATCLLAAPGLDQLKADATGKSTRTKVDCAACRAWQATHRERRSPPMMARLRAAFVPGRAA